MKRHSALCAVAVLALATASCGSDDNTSSTSGVAVTVGTLATTSSASSAPTDTEASTSESSEADSSTNDTTEIESRFETAKDALKDGDFSTMLAALNLSGLSDTINENQVTILAPTDEAFTELSGDQMKDLIMNPTKVDDVLKRHILGKVYSYDELAAADDVKTLGGDTLTVTVNGDNVTIDGALVSKPESEQTSGESGQEVAVFAIDRVLLEDG